MKFKRIQHLWLNATLFLLFLLISIQATAGLDLLNFFSKHPQHEPLNQPGVTTSILLYQSGTIKNSFHRAAARARFTHKQYLAFIHIFANTINFRTDLHSGDRFSILYKAYFKNGKEYKRDPISFAQITIRGKKYQAVYYQYGKHGHYYFFNGHETRRTYLRAPLHYKRISGHFTYHRYDPVLHVVRPHLGIDYAANWGTPIHSIGDGVIIFCGKRGGYGNAVMVRYSNRYKALYGHMSRFARHLHVNEPIKKGQVLGYVGSTGWSTGPHLHFEFYVWGRPHNPLTVHLPHDQPIPRHYLHKFRDKVHTYLAELEFYQTPEFAER